MLLNKKRFILILLLPLMFSCSAQKSLPSKDDYTILNIFLTRYKDTIFVNENNKSEGVLKFYKGKFT